MGLRFGHAVPYIALRSRLACGQRKEPGETPLADPTSAPRPADGSAQADGTVASSASSRAPLAWQPVAVCCLA